MRSVLTGLLALTGVAAAQDWKDRLEVFESIQTLQAPEGFEVQSSPGGHVVKDVSKAEPVHVKAALDVEGKRYYMSDWSWTRYQSGKEPYWILLRGKVIPEPPAQPEAAPGPVASAGAEGEEPAKVVKPNRPLTLEEQLEMKWAGELELFSSTRDIPAPKGYKLLASPNREEKALRTNGSKSSFTAQAVLTRKDGYAYYISDWSWSRAKAGKEPSWMHLIGSKPQPERLTDAKGDAGETGPVHVASITPGTASLMETVAQMVRPKLTLDSVEASGRVVALLIGNSRYSSANRTQQMLDLEDPPFDVELLGRTLRTLNAEVREERDLDLERMEKVIQETAASLRAGDVFLFYYAGHALQLAGKNFLVPLGINFLDRKTVRESAYSLDSLWKAISNQSLRFAAVCLDGCRKNPFNAKDSTFYILSRIPGLNLADSGGKPGLAAEKPPGNAMLSFAAEPGLVMADSPPGGRPSRYAEALAAALAENVEIRQVMDTVHRRVTEATGRQQIPWMAAADFPQFYLHTPGRSSLDPDQAVERAGEWMLREKDKGLPIALGLLARSVREQPDKNPATAGLLFLLGYQSIPVPVKSWGPFAAPDGEVASDMQLSIDGRYLALCSPKEGKPVLILDRERGDVVSEAEQTFAQGFGKVAIVREGLGPSRVQGAGDLSVISFQRKPEGNSGGDGEIVHAMTALLPKSRMVASFYDEGLERVLLAFADETKKLTFSEYSTTPPVGCREEFRIASPVPDLAKTGSIPLAAGAVPAGPEGPAQVWSLVFDAASDQIRFLRGSEPVYRRDGATKPERRIDDWRVDLPARKLVLVYRDHVDVLGLNGVAVSRFDLPASSSGARKVLACNAAFRRLVLAWGAADPAEEGKQQISVFDLSNGQRVGGSAALVGYAEFAAVSPDQEWFLYYDAARRIRLVDMISGGARFHFPGTATLQPLPVGAGLEPGADSEPAFPSPELHQPPWLEGLGAASKAPTWLPDLAEALIGFKVNENSEVEWLDNAPKRVESAIQQMRRRPGDGAQQSWAKWILANRLGSDES